MKTTLQRLFLASCVVAFAPGSAHAQTWPTKPLKLVVPYAAGGSTDQLARALADNLSRALGQTVVVENKPGGNTIIGAEAVARAAPDGYTLFMGSSASLAVNPLLYAKLPYDPKADFTGVSMLATSPLVMVVNPGVPAKTVKDFIVLAKALLDNPAEVARAYPAASATVTRNAAANTFLPFHPGAVRYYREKGVALKAELTP